MSDKPTEKLLNHDDEQELSLNHLNFNDDMQGEGDSTYADDRQDPAVPDLFESAAELNSADHARDLSDGRISSAHHPEQANTSALDDHAEDDYFAGNTEQVQHNSERKTTLVFAIIAVVITVFVVVWFNLTGHVEDEKDVLDMQNAQTHLSDDSQPLRTQARVSLLQERLSSLQARLVSKDKQIAELTHQVSEQSRQLQASVSKKTTELKKAPAVQKPRAQLTPVQHHTAGRWAIVLASVNSRAAAEKAIARLKAKGIAADIFPTTVKGKAWFRVRLSGFASRAEAEIQKASLAQQYGIKGVWIHKSK